MIWPFNIVSKLRASNYDLNHTLNTFKQSTRQQTAQLNNAWKTIHELNHGRTHLIRLCKQRKQQLLDANIRPVEAYDYKEPEPATYLPIQTMVAVAIFFNDHTLTKIIEPEKLDLFLSSSLPTPETDTYASMMENLGDLNNWKGHTPVIWEYAFTTNQEDIAIMAMRIDPAGVIT